VDDIACKRNLLRGNLTCSNGNLQYSKLQRCVICPSTSFLSQQLPSCIQNQPLAFLFSLKYYITLLCHVYIFIHSYISQLDLAILHVLRLTLLYIHFYFPLYKSFFFSYSNPRYLHTLLVRCSRSDCSFLLLYTPITTIL